MSDAPAASPAILLTMTAVTGVVDAVSFLAMGHVFTANMTGNDDHGADADGMAADSRLAGGDSPRWQRRPAAIVAMLAGATAGTLMVVRSISLPRGVCSVITAGCAIAHMHINSKRSQL